MNGRKPSKRYWQAYGALMGDDQLVPQVKPARKPRSKEEEIEQKKFNKWAAEMELPWYHTPNGGRRSKLEALNLRAMGLKRGIPDIVIPLARSPYHGLVIELKRIDGTLSDLSEDQKLRLNWYAKNNHMACVAFGFAKAKEFVEEYLDGRPIQEHERWYDVGLEKVNLSTDVRSKTRIVIMT